MTARNINTSRHTAHDYLTPTLVPKFTDLRKRLEFVLFTNLPISTYRIEQFQITKAYLSFFHRNFTTVLGDKLDVYISHPALNNNDSKYTPESSYKQKNMKESISRCIIFLHDEWRVHWLFNKLARYVSYVSDEDKHCWLHAFMHVCIILIYELCNITLIARS